MVKVLQVFVLVWSLTAQSVRAEEESSLLQTKSFSININHKNDQDCRSGKCEPETTTELVPEVQAAEFTTTPAQVDTVAGLNDQPSLPISNPVDNAHVSRSDLCATSIRLTTNKANLLHNNLGGLGPNRGDSHEIRYVEAGVNKDGTPFDLVVTVDSLYKNANQTAAVRKGCGKKPWCNINGVWGDFGNINLVGSANFNFSFQNTYTHDPIQLDAVMFSWFDLDQNKGWKVRERVSTCEAAEAYVTKPRKLELNKQGKCAEIVSLPGGVDNPTDFKALTNEQKAVSAVTAFVDTSTIQVQLESSTQIRNILFMAHPSFGCEEFEEPEPFEAVDPWE